MYKWLGLILFSLFPTEKAVAASFDCAKAGTKIEKLICTTPNLSELDEKYSQVYRQVKKQQPEDEHIKYEALAALKQRESVCSEVECLEKWYRYRLFVLESRIANANAKNESGSQTNPNTVYKNLDCATAHSTIGIERCTSRKVFAARDIMNGYFNKSMERFADDVKVTSALQQGQSAWLEHVKSHCNAVWQIWRDGSIKNVRYLMCELNLVQQRTYVLWQSLRVFADSTSSLLPEPFPIDAGLY